MSRRFKRSSVRFARSRRCRGQIDATQPTTGYEDVKRMALSRLLADVDTIQVDWALYGPKLAQVALTFGADDIDSVSAGDDESQAGAARQSKRSAGAFRAAGFEPVERDGRFERDERRSTSIRFAGRRQLPQYATSGAGLEPRPIASACASTCRLVRRAAARERGRSRADSVDRIPRARLPDRAGRFHRIRWSGGVGGALHQGADRAHPLHRARYQLANVAGAAASACARDGSTSSRSRADAARPYRHARASATPRWSSATTRCSPTTRRSASKDRSRRRVGRHDRPAVRVCLLGRTARRRRPGRRRGAAGGARPGRWRQPLQLAGRRIRTSPRGLREPIATSAKM